MVLNSDGLAKCSGTAKALQIREMPGRADVSKLLRTAFATFCSAVPIDGANCGLLDSGRQWTVVAFTN